MFTPQSKCTSSKSHKLIKTTLFTFVINHDVFLRTKTEQENQVIATELPISKKKKGINVVFVNAYTTELPEWSRVISSAIVIQVNHNHTNVRYETPAWCTVISLVKSMVQQVKKSTDTRAERSTGTLWDIRARH